MKQQHKTETTYKYKGITIHAARGLHEYAMDIVLRTCNKKGHILDLGCGSGAFSKRLQDYGFRTTSVDLSLDTFALRSESCQIDLNTDFTEQLSVRYDAIVALEVIEHLENPLQFLRQIKLIAGPDAVTLISFPNMNMYMSLVTFYKEGTFGNWSPFLYWETGHQTVMPDWLFEEHLKKIGFTLEKKHFCAPVAFPQNIIKRMYHKVFFKLACFFNERISPEARMNEAVLFQIRNRVNPSEPFSQPGEKVV